MLVVPGELQVDFLSFWLVRPYPPGNMSISEMVAFLSRFPQEVCVGSEG
jgi:hypothetical protein